MRVVQIKCKNCGATVKVKENAKEAECEYCNSKFTIEKSETDYVNETIQNGSKIVYIIFTIAFIVILAIIIFTIISISNSFKHSSLKELNNYVKENTTVTSQQAKQVVLYDINELSDTNIEEIHRQSNNKLIEEVTDEMFSTVKNKEQVKMYLISDKNKNTLFDVYKVTYHVSFGSTEKDDSKYVVVSYSNIYIKDDKLYYDSKYVDTKRRYIGSVSVKGYDSLEQVSSMVENKKETDMKISEK